MAEKTIGQAVWEKAQDALHQDYFADVRRVISAFKGHTITEETHFRFQRELNYSYAKFVVFHGQHMARIKLEKFEQGKDFTITIHWPSPPWEGGTTHKTEEFQ